MASTDRSKSLADSVSKLSLEVGGPAKTKKPKKIEVADDWEAEASSDDDDAEAENSRPSTAAKAGTNAPPPTPISPVAKGEQAFGLIPFSSSTLPPSIPEDDYDPGQERDRDSSSNPDPNKRRPEKTDAVARRMIASALGMKMPKRTEEERKYDKAVSEKEHKRRAEERAAQKLKEEEAARAKQAIWED